MDDPLDQMLDGPSQSAAPASDIPSLITAAEQKYKLPPGLLASVIHRGENSGATATSPKGAMGVAQLMPGTARDMGVTNPDDPVQGIDGGARYLSQMLAQHQGNVPLAVAAYNAGPGAVAKYGGVPPFKETQAYVNRVTGPGGYSPDLDGLLGDAPAPASGNSFSSALGNVSGGAASNPAAPTPPQTFGQALAEASPESTKIGSGQYIFSGDGPHAREPVNAAQEATLSNMKLDQDAPPGLDNYPYALTRDGAPPVEHGVAYIDQNGVLQHTAMTPAEQAALADMEAKVGPAHGSLAVTNGLLQGYEPEAAGLVRGAQSAFVNALGGGKPAPYGPAEAAWAANRVANERLSQYRMAHPIANALLTGGGSLASGAVATGALGEGLNALKVPEMLGPSGAFLSGQAGQGAEGVGGSMLRAGSGVAQNALQGASMGVEANHLTPNESPVNSAVNGALGGAALGLVGKGARVLGRAVGEAVPAIPNALTTLATPFSSAARESIADRAIREFAGSGNTALDTTEYVPGSTPTLATATGNPGLMQAEKVMRATPKGATVFGDLDAQNQQARARAVEALRGDNDSLQNMIDARSDATSNLRNAAFQNASPTDPTPAIQKIDEILASPEGKRDAVQRVMQNVRGKLFDANGNPETDPAQLYGVRQALTDLYSTADSQDAKVASKQLSDVKGALDGVIENGAPGYKDYLSAFNDASGPIDERKFLLARSLTDARDQPTLAKVKTTLDAIDSAQRKPGVNNGKSVSDDTYQKLQNLRADLARADINPDKTTLSPTFQNLNGNALLQKLQVPMAIGGLKVPGLSLLHAGANALYSKQGDRISDIMLNKLANPEYGASAFAPPDAPAPSSASPLYPGLAGGYVNQLLTGGGNRTPVPATR